GGPAFHPASGMLRFLNVIVTALARSGTSLGRRAVAAHALRGDPRLGDTLSRLSELSGADFSGDGDTLEKLLAALKAAIPMKVFGMTIARDSERVMVIIKALASTPAPAGETTVAGSPAGQQFMPLLMEAMRRYDELQRAAAIVGDHVRLKPTGAKPTAPPEESDGVFVRDLWTKVKGGTTAAECEPVI